MTAASVFRYRQACRRDAVDGAGQDVTGCSEMTTRRSPTARRRASSHQTRFFFPAANCGDILAAVRRLALNGVLGRERRAAAAKNNPCFPLHLDGALRRRLHHDGVPALRGPNGGRWQWRRRPTHLCNASSSVDDAVAALPPTASRRRSASRCSPSSPSAASTCNVRRSAAPLAEGVRARGGIAYRADTARAGTRLTLLRGTLSSGGRTTELDLGGVGFVESDVEPPRWASRFHAVVQQDIRARAHAV